MISLEAVQAAIIARLKADALLVSRIGVEIRESQWQGTQFTYPCVRVGEMSGVPLGEDLCGPRNSRNRFMVLSMSEEASSQEADTNMGLVVRALAGQTLTGTGTTYTNPFTSGLVRVVSPGQQSATINDQNVWTARTTFEVNIYEQS